MMRGYLDRMLRPSERPRLRFASMADVLAFERDLALYGNAFVNPDGKHVPAADVDTPKESKLASR